MNNIIQGFALVIVVFLGLLVLSVAGFLMGHLYESTRSWTAPAGLFITTAVGTSALWYGFAIFVNIRLAIKKERGAHATK